MEIQQHDGVVVDVAGCRQGFAELLRERERCCRGGGRRPRLLCCCPPSPPLYRPLGGCASPKRWDLKGGGGHKGGKGLPCPPRQGGTPPPLGFPTLGAWGEAQGGAPAH